MSEETVESDHDDLLDAAASESTRNRVLAVSRSFEEARVESYDLLGDLMTASYSDPNGHLRLLSEMLSATSRLLQLVEDYGVADPGPHGILSTPIFFVEPRLDFALAELLRSLAEVRSTANNLLSGADEAFEDSATIARSRLLRELKSTASAVRPLLERVPDPARRLRSIGEMNAIQERVGQLTEREAFRDAVNEIRKARDEAVETADHAKEAAGITGSVELSEHFSNYANAERRTANWLRATCIFVTLSIAGFAGYLLLRVGTPTTSTTEELARLAFALPLAALAAYLGKESSNHRASSRWARDIEVQLRTVRAYTDELPESMRDEIRAELAKRIFGGQSPMLSASGPSVATDAAGLLSSISDLVKRQDSSKGKS